MALNVHYMRILSKRKCACHVVAAQCAAAHHVRMPREPKTKHFLRAWRDRRGMTLEQVGEVIGMTHQNLGKIERGKVPYNQLLLEQLSEVYGCSPADLLVRDPSASEGIWTLWEGLQATQREQLVEIAKTLKRVG